MVLTENSKLNTSEECRLTPKHNNHRTCWDWNKSSQLEGKDNNRVSEKPVVVDCAI